MGLDQLLPEGERVNKKISWRRITERQIYSEFSYLAGVILGDGHCNMSANKVELTVADEAFADSFYKCLNDIGVVPYKNEVTKNNGNTYYDVSCTSKSLTEIINNKIYTLGRELERPVFRNKEIVQEFVRGFYESEGNFNKTKTGDVLVMVNTDEEIIDFVRLAVAYAGFYCSKDVEKRECNKNVEKEEGRKDIYRLTIGGQEDVERFINQIKPVIKY